MAADLQTYDVTDLVFSFAAGLRALVPHFDATGVSWRRADRYDDFDRVAEALYCAFVLSPAASDARFAELGLDLFRPFGFDGPEGTWAAQVEARHPEFGDLGAVRDLDTSRQPFDQLVVDHGIGKVALREVACGVVGPDGEFVRLLHVDQ